MAVPVLAALKVGSMLAKTGGAIAKGGKLAMKAGRKGVSIAKKTKKVAGNVKKAVIKKRKIDKNIFNGRYYECVLTLSNTSLSFNLASVSL